MRINDVVGTGFARLPIGCPADPPALARLVQVNLDRSVLADRLFVDPIYEHHPCACAFYFDPSRFSTGAPTPAWGTLCRHQTPLTGLDWLACGARPGSFRLRRRSLWRS